MHSMDTALAPLTDRIRAAANDGVALRIRGGGSKDFYGDCTHGELLDTTGLSGIVAYEPTELVVTVGAGTPLAELEALLGERGQCLAFEPPHFCWAGRAGATVGGMVAAGLSGPSRASAGAVREYVLGLRMLNGLGQELVFGGQVMKNVAGYDVSRMMVGSMGTLGLIAEISLKVLPVAPAEATLVFALDQASALESLHRWGGQPLPLNASCWVHDEGAGQDLLFVRLRGAVAAVEAACQKMLAEQTGQRMDNAQARGDWQLCRDQQLPFFARPDGSAMALWRLSVAQTAPVLDLPWAQLVEWHGGLRWLWAPEDADARLQAVAQAHGGYATFFVAQQAYSTRASGCFTAGPPQGEMLPPGGQRNTRSDKRGGLISISDPAHAAIQQRLKHSLDPHGIFNPHRLFHAW